MHFALIVLFLHTRFGDMGIDVQYTDVALSSCADVFMFLQL